MRMIKNELENILKPISISVNKIIDIDIDDLFNSFATKKQQVYDLICKTSVYFPIPINDKTKYLEHINYMFTEKEYFSQSGTIKGIHRYSELHFIANDHIEFIKKILKDYSINLSNSLYGKNKDEIVILMKRFIYEFERLAIFKKYDLIDTSEVHLFEQYYIDLFKNELLHINDFTQAAQKRKGLATYQWLTNPDKELPELYKRMIDGKFIAEIDFPAFRAIFTGQPVESITVKLKWLKSKALLAYFILSIRNKIPVATDIWQVAKHCFEDANSLKQSYFNYKGNTINNGLPKDYEQINDLLKDL